MISWFVNKFSHIFNKFVVLNLFILEYWNQENQDLLLIIKKSNPQNKHWKQNDLPQFFLLHKVSISSNTKTKKIICFYF